MGILDKISEINEKEENKLNFKISYKDKEIFNQDMELKSFASDVLDNAEVSLYYACKDFVNKIEKILAEKHKDMVLNKASKSQEGVNG